MLEREGSDLVLLQGCPPCKQPGPLPQFCQCFLSWQKTDGDGSVPVLHLSPHCHPSWHKPPPWCKVPLVGALCSGSGSGCHCQKQGAAWPPSPKAAGCQHPAWGKPGSGCAATCCLLPLLVFRSVFLSCIMGLLLSLYILFWALAWGHLFSVSMWRVSRSPVLL